MLSICEAVLKNEFIKGGIVQPVGGLGYDNKNVRQRAPGPEQAKQQAQEALINSQRNDQLINARSKKNQPIQFPNPKDVYAQDGVQGMAA